MKEKTSGFFGGCPVEYGAGGIGQWPLDSDDDEYKDDDKDEEDEDEQQ